MSTNEPHGRRIRTTLVIFLSLLLIVLGINLLMVAPYLLAIMMGAIIATLSFPLYQRINRAGAGRRTAALLITLSILALALGPIGGFSFLSVKQGIALGQKLAQDQSLDIESVGDKIAKWRPVKALGIEPTDIKKQLRTTLRDAGTLGSKTLLAMVGGLPATLLQLTLALLACFFLLTDGQRLLFWLNDKLPIDRDVRLVIYKSFHDTAFSAILASFAAAATQSFLTLAAYLLLGVPLAFFAAGVTFVLSWLPVIGATPAWVVAAIYLFTQDKPLAGVLMIAFGLFIGVADNIVRPWVLKGRSNMHPLVALVAIIGGIEIFGFFGIFFGPVITGILLSLLEVWPMVARRFHLMPLSVRPSTAANLHVTRTTKKPDIERKAS